MLIFLYHTGQHGRRSSTNLLPRLQARYHP
jgi:hypothetical protein